MAYTLKLNIYRFCLYRITNTVVRQTMERERNKYETESSPTTFYEVARTIDTNVDRNRFLPVLFQSLVSYFDRRFKVNDEGTKAVSITTPPSPIYNSTGYVINGLFKGGDTGIGKTIFSQHNAIQPGTRITNTDVPVNNYYYKLWMPYDGEDGVLMIQSYTDMGCTVTFRDQMEKFFISKGYLPKWNSMIPSGFIDQYLNRSFINEIKVVYTSERRQEYGIFASLSNVKKESRLKKLHIPFSDLFRMDNYRQRLQDKILEYVDYDQQHDLVKVFYEDENGKKASATLNNIEDVLPSIILPEELKNCDTEEPELSLIRSYTDSILDEIKRQMGYTPSEME